MIEQQKIFANDLNHHLRIAGTNGVAMILLHGWPETSYTWRHVMDALEGCIRSRAVESEVVMRSAD